MYDDIILFTKVVRFGGFAQASRQLSITQATISRRIQNLEYNLGFIILKRNARTLELTETGQKLYDEFIDQDAYLNNKINQLRSEKQQLTGRINVSLPPGISYGFITPHIPEFIRLHPELSINIVYQTREVDLIRENFDLAVISTLPKSQTQKIRLLFSTKYIACCTKLYAENYGLPQTLDELFNKHLVIALSNNGVINKQINVYKGNDETPITLDAPQHITINTGAQTLNMILSNHAIGGLTKHDFDRLPPNTMLHVLPDYIFGNLNFYIMRKNSEENAKVDAFVNFLESCFKKNID